MARSAPATGINPHVLRWARDSAGHGLADVAGAVGVSAEKVASWEQGEAEPTFRQLEKLANKVKRPMAALFLPEPPDEPPPPRDLRTFPGSTGKPYSAPLRLAIRRARVLRETATELLTALGEEVRGHLYAARTVDDASRVAGELRTLIGVSVEEQVACEGHGRAISVFRDALFEQRVLALQFSFPVDEARGFALAEDVLPVAAVSSKDEPSARLFSLFHEVGHLCLHLSSVSGYESVAKSAVDADRDAVESFCNRFAASFLMPRDDPFVSRAFGSVRKAGVGDVNEVRIAAARLKVSKYALLYRMRELSAISAAELAQGLAAARAFDHRVMDARKDKTPLGGPSYWEQKYHERGRAYASLVLDALDRGVIHLHSALGALEVSSAWLDKIRENTYGRARWSGARR